MIRFKCSNCGARLFAKNQAAGGTLDCPSCRAKVRVPMPTGQAESGAAPEPKANDKTRVRSKRRPTSDPSRTGSSTRPGHSRAPVNSKTRAQRSSQTAVNRRLKEETHSDRTSLDNTGALSADFDDSGNSLSIAGVPEDDGLLPLDLSDDSRKMLDQLESLRNAGVINDREFRKFKARLAEMDLGPE